MCGVNDVKEVIKVAVNERKFKRKTILFMDEIHRFNKLQQVGFSYDFPLMYVCVLKELIAIGRFKFVNPTTALYQLSIFPRTLFCRTLRVEQLH